MSKFESCTNYPGITVHYSNARTNDAEQHSITMLVCKKDGKKILQQTFRSHKNESFDAFLSRLCDNEKTFLLSSADKISKVFSSKHHAAMPLALYLLLHWDAIAHASKWARKAQAYQAAWEHKLLPAFGELTLAECRDDQRLLDLLEKLTRRRAQRRSATEEENGFVIFLHDVLKHAIAKNHLPFDGENLPLTKEYHRARQKLTTVASARLARKSLSLDESKSVVALCLKNQDVSDAYRAVLLLLLSGMTVEEVCGLDLNCLEQTEICSWICVRQMYHVTKSQEPQLSILLEDANAYRNYPATDFIRKLWADQVARQGRRGYPQPETPLFFGTDDQRLTPAALKAVVKDVLDKTVWEGTTLTFRERNGVLPGKDRPTLAYTETLRGTADYALRYYCDLSDEKVNVLLGRAASQVLADHYIDWNNPWLLRRQSLLISQKWHAHLFDKEASV